MRWSNPATWSTYAALRGAPARGLVLSAADDIVCIDLDACVLEDGTLTPPAAELVAMAGRTWVELSASGRGLHIWGRAPFAAGRKLQWHGGKVEVYGGDRFLAVTGKSYGSSPSVLGDVSGLVAEVLAPQLQD